MTIPAKCEARAREGIFQCDRCALAFHDMVADAPSCKAVTYERMRRAVLDAAFRIRASQVILLRSGDRQRPDPGEIMKALLLDAACRLIDRCDGTPAVKAALKATAPKRPRPAEPAPCVEIENPGHDGAE